MYDTYNLQLYSIHGGYKPIEQPTHNWGQNSSSKVKPRPQLESPTGQTSLTANNCKVVTAQWFEGGL